MCKNKMFHEKHPVPGRVSLYWTKIMMLGKKYLKLENTYCHVLKNLDTRRFIVENLLHFFLKLSFIQSLYQGYKSKLPAGT